MEAPWHSAENILLTSGSACHGLGLHLHGLKKKKMAAGTRSHDVTPLFVANFTEQGKIDLENPIFKSGGDEEGEKLQGSREEALDSS